MTGRPAHPDDPAHSAGPAPSADPAAGLAADQLSLGGRPDDVALRWGGRTLTYADLAELIDHTIDSRPPAAPSRDAPPRDISTLPLPEALACAFAAARTGTAVLVRDPAAAGPDIGPVPAGTWLVAATSGSTGRPRAVCRTAESWAMSVRPLAALAGLGPGDRVLLTGPLHATLHLHAAIHTVAIGAELTDDAATATAVHAVPAVLSDLLRDLPATSPLRTAVVAGSALPDALARRADDRGVAVTEYYGAAELSFVAARRWPAPALVPFPGVRVRIDAEGVVWARSPFVAIGYAGAAPGSLRLDDDGFATVGDLASAPGGDPDTGMVILGRGDIAVTTGGFTVLVEEVEAALAALPGVRAAAVVGMPHARLGEVVTAALELSPGTDLASVRAAARAVVAGPSRPRRYVAVATLPRTGGGKIARAAVREMLHGVRDGAPVPHQITES